MRKALLSLVFLTLALLIPATTAMSAYIYCPGCGGGSSGSGGGNNIVAIFYPCFIGNDAGIEYNLSRITFVTTIVNLSGTFSVNPNLSEPQYVVFYIALGKITSSGACYVQPGICLFFDNGWWYINWFAEAWLSNGTNEYASVGFITSGPGNSVTLNCLFNLSIKVTLNNQGEITSVWCYVANAKTGQVYYSKTITLKYPIPDKQVFFEVEDPLNGSGQPTNFPIIPTNPYVFIDAFASNSTATYHGLPLYKYGSITFMKWKSVDACEAPILSVDVNNGLGSQGVYNCK